MFSRFAQYFTNPSTSLFFIGLLFCLPFMVSYHHLPIAAFYGEWLAAALGVAAMLALMSKNFWQEVKLPQISLVFLGLAAILNMQWMLNMLHSPQFALLILSYLAWAFVLVVLGSYLRQQLGWEKIATTLSWFLVLGGIANIIFVGLQIALKSKVDLPFMPKLTSYGALSQANNFADYMALATASLMYLYAKKQLQLKLFIVGLMLFISLLAFSGSRSSWLYLGFISLLAIGLQIKSIKQLNGSPNIRSLLRVSLLLLPLFAIIQLALHYALPDNLISLPTEELMEGLNAKTASMRGQFWQTSWHLFSQSPWLGIGAGQMRWQTFVLLDTPNLNPAKMIFEHSHNLFIHLLTEMGIGAALLALIGLGAWARAFKWRELHLETWWLIALLGVIGIHSMLEYPLWYTYFLGVFAFLLGAGEEKLTQFNLAKFARLSGASTFGLVLIVAAINLSTLAIANYKLEKWSTTLTDKNIGKMNNAKLMSEFNWIQKNSLLAPYAQLLLLNELKVNDKQIDDLTWMSESVMRFMPTRRVTYQYALLLKLKGDEAGAVKQLNRALIAHPKGLNRSLQEQSIQYWQYYLDVLYIARPIPIKKQQTAP